MNVNTVGQNKRSVIDAFRSLIKLTNTRIVDRRGSCYIEGTFMSRTHRTSDDIGVVTRVSSASYL